MAGKPVEGELHSDLWKDTEEILKKSTQPRLGPVWSSLNKRASFFLLMPEKGTLNVSSRKKLTKILKWALSHRQEPFRPGLVLLHRQAGINWPRSSCFPNTSSWREILVRNRRQAGCSEAGRQSLGWAYLSFTTILHEAGSAWKETKVQRCEGTLGHSCLGAEETAVVCVFRAMQVVALNSPVSYYPVLGGRPPHQSGQQHSSMKSRCGRVASRDYCWGPSSLQVLSLLVSCSSTLFCTQSPISFYLSTKALNVLGSFDSVNPC